MCRRRNDATDHGLDDRGESLCVAPARAARDVGHGAEHCRHRAGDPKDVRASEPGTGIKASQSGLGPLPVNRAGGKANLGPFLDELGQVSELAGSEREGSHQGLILLGLSLRPAQLIGALRRRRPVDPPHPKSISGAWTSRSEARISQSGLRRANSAASAHRSIWYFWPKASAPIRCCSS
jgi:hypothetical protein